MSKATSILNAAVVIVASICSLHAQVTPAKLEINLGPVPLDHYTDANFDQAIGQPILKTCRDTNGLVRTDWTIRQCIQNMLSTSPYGYVNQGVTGVRFMFAIGRWELQHSIYYDGHAARPGKYGVVR
jgi:hypothetical protein